MLRELQPNVGDSRSIFLPKYKVDVSDYKSDLPLYTYMVERRCAMKPYTERQLQILGCKIQVDQIKNTELGRLMKKAAEAEDSEGLATAQYCLETFYGDGNTYGSNAAYYVSEYFKIEQSSAYKRKNRALDKLTVLLFGKP